jgi:hypothetical protein
MEIERYFLKIKPEQIISSIVNERVNEIRSKLYFVENLIKEKLGNKANELNLCLLMGNAVKSVEERVQFLEILEKNGMEERDLNIVKELLKEAAVGDKEKPSNPYFVSSVFYLNPTLHTV